MAKDIFERLSADGRQLKSRRPWQLPCRYGSYLTGSSTLDQPTICARDIYRHGPRPVREDRETALEAAEILERRGWVVRLPTHRCDRKRWQITIGPV